MSNPENNLAPDKAPAKQRFFRLPSVLKIDYNKPASFKKQLAVMVTFLLLSCAVLVGIYVFHVMSGKITWSGEPILPEVSKAVPAVSKPSDSASKAPAKPEKKITKVLTANQAVLKNMTTVEKTQEDVYKGPLILVNKDYPCRLNGENIKDVFDYITDDYTLADLTVGFDEEMIEPFNTMMADFTTLYGRTNILVACGYRSLETQQQIMLEEEEIKQRNQLLYEDSDDPQKEAEQWVAPPGYSEHQTGLAFDFDLMVTEGGNIGITYDGEGNYEWFGKNCGNYGFTLRYRQNKEEITGYLYEPWHFRYVGLPHAQYIEDHDLTFEEYMDFLHKHTTENAIVMEDHESIKWCIYYVPASEDGVTNVPVPKDYEYSVSGDNMVNEQTEGYGGYIVTVRLGLVELSSIAAQEKSSTSGKGSSEKPSSDKPSGTASKAESEKKASDEDSEKTSGTNEPEISSESTEDETDSQQTEYDEEYPYDDDME